MGGSIQSEQAIFEIARKITDHKARSAYLTHACTGEELQERVQSLLRAYDERDSFLEASPPGLAPLPTTYLPPADRPADMIGPYKLLQVIGEGGMGVVYMAEQNEPVARRVALKIIKPGMDSRQVIARFEAERQALAMMDHQNIAKVFEAGTTNSGQPYFVMELVKGTPITKYCDEKHLSLKERLELMIPVCQAIQHAHQKGIIHRDIKPTNVLVALHDGLAVPKVIDFGVAKATAQKLTDRTMFTELGQLIGTLEYMSPEQAEPNQLDIDTRSDIYSLGVLLYELLTGSTPFDKQKLRTAAFLEMLRIIREDEPPKPSTNLSTSGMLPSIAANRQTEPARLSKAVRGELDWIVMKSLEKDRKRRYETATAFAADLQRYLNDEAVQACPPSSAYRFSKFARRNKVALTTAALVALALIVGTSVSTWQAVRATRAEAQATANLARALAGEKRVEETLLDRIRIGNQQNVTIVSQRQLLEQDNRIYTMFMDEILAVLRDRPASDSKRHTFLVTALKPLGKLDAKERANAFRHAGNLFVGMNEYSAAISAYTEGLTINPRHTGIYISRGDVFFRQQEFDKAISDYTSAIENRQPKDLAEGDLPFARRGFAWCRLNKFDQALADFTASYEAKPRESLAFLVQGFRGLGTLNAPIDDRLHAWVTKLFDRYVEEQQGSTDARNFVGDSLAAIKRGEAARKKPDTEGAGSGHQ